MAKVTKPANNTVKETPAFTVPLLKFDRQRSSITFHSDLLDGEYNLTVKEAPKPSSNKKRPALVAKAAYESTDGKTSGITILMLTHLLTELKPSELEDDAVLIATGHVGKKADGTLSWIVRPHYRLTKDGNNVTVV